MTAQDSLFSPLADVDFFRDLIADLHDDLAGKIARLRQLADFSMGMGVAGTMIPGETSHVSWLEARSSFVHGKGNAGRWPSRTILIASWLFQTQS